MLVSRAHSRAAAALALPREQDDEEFPRTADLPAHGDCHDRPCRRTPAACSAVHDCSRGRNRYAGERELSRAKRRFGWPPRYDSGSRYTVFHRHPASGPHRELPGRQLQGRLEVSAAGGLPGAAGAQHPASADPRHARRQFPELQARRHDDVRHRRQCVGAVSTDRGGERALSRALWAGQSVRHVQLRLQTADSRVAARSDRKLHQRQHRHAQGGHRWSDRPQCDRQRPPERRVRQR